MNETVNPLKNETEDGLVGKMYDNSRAKAPDTEMTRRLIDEIRLFNKKSTFYARMMLLLSVVIIIITVVQIIKK